MNVKLNDCFEIYMDEFKRVFAADVSSYQLSAFKSYCRALYQSRKNAGRKSVNRLLNDKNSVETDYQKFIKFISGDWSNNNVLLAVFKIIEPYMEKKRNCHWVINEIQLPKSRGKSIGVERVESEQQGKPIYCQTAIALSLATQSVNLPIAYRLYLSKSASGKVSSLKKLEICSKSIIAINQIENALADGYEKPAVVFAGSEFGNSMEFRNSLTRMGLSYLVSITDDVDATLNENVPIRLGLDHQKSVRKLALDMWIADAKSEGHKNYNEISWRDKKGSQFKSFFAARRIHLATDTKTLGGPEWLLLEWPEQEDEPCGYWLSTLDPRISIRTLISYAKRHQSKNDLFEKLRCTYGLFNYEGQNWQGFHNHATMCIATYAHEFYCNMPKKACAS